MLSRQELKDLKDKKFRRENNIFLLEGDKFCKDLLSANIKILKTITTQTDLKDFPNVEVVDKKVLDSLSSTVTPQTIIFVCEKPVIGFDSVVNSVVLDNLQDPGNVGTLIRSAVAFGFNDVYLVGGVDPYNEKVVRSSAGTILKARIHCCDFSEFDVSKEKISKYFVVADMFGESLNEIRLPNSKIAVIIGNEGNGVSDSFLNIANIKVSIPMMNGVESLNAGVAGSIIMQKFMSN